MATSEERDNHIAKLRKLLAWLKRNPNNNPLVDEEAAAVEWALGELESE